MTVSVKLKCGKSESCRPRYCHCRHSILLFCCLIFPVSVAVPVTASTKVSELKTILIEAIHTSLEELKDSEGLDEDPTTSTIKLFKQSEDDQGNEKWIPLEDVATVDKAGLDQGHVVGVSFQRDGRFYMYRLYPCENNALT